MSGGRFQGDLPERTLAFAVDVLSIVETIPPGSVGWTVGKQLARSGTSIGANVREADHALTQSEFVHRCSIARKEASETVYWLTLCHRVGLADNAAANPLLAEAEELTRILSSIVKKLTRPEVPRATNATRTALELST